MPDLTPAQVLRAAAGKVRQGWTQGFYARDTEGQPIHPWDRSAVCWCAKGALRATTVYHGPAVSALLAFLGEPVVDWNDAPGRTAEEVAAAMEQAADKWEANHA